MRISDQSVEALRFLLGRRIFTIDTPSLDAAGAHLAAPSLSLLLEKDSFVNFSCKWFETPRYLNDSWLITIARSEAPIGITIRNGALIEPCTISMYDAKSIERIEVFEFRNAEDEEEDEWVQYDRALLFHCSEGRRFCISCMLNGPGIAEYLHFSEDANIIQEMISDLTPRIVLHQ